MKVKLYGIIERAIEEGIELGYRRAFKHTDDPSEEQIVESISRAVMFNIDEVMSFDDEVSIN